MAPGATGCASCSEGDPVDVVVDDLVVDDDEDKDDDEAPVDEDNGGRENDAPPSTSVSGSGLTDEYTCFEGSEGACPAEEKPMDEAVGRSGGREEVDEEEEEEEVVVVKVDVEGAMMGAEVVGE